MAVAEASFSTSIDSMSAGLIDAANDPSDGNPSMM